MAAAWKAGFLQASFRRIEFFIEGHTYNGGRRNKQHIFPERDNTENEDLGLAPRKYKLSAYISGPDYFQQRDALRNALESGGPGTLVHPYLGTKRVVVDGDYSMTETVTEGCVARFDITFAEDVLDDITFTVTNTQQTIVSSTQALFDAMTEDFVDGYTIETATSTGLQDALAAVAKITDIIQKAKKIANTVADFQRKIANIKGKIAAYTLNAAQLMDNLIPVIDFGNNPFDLVVPIVTSKAKKSFDEIRQIVQRVSEPLTVTPIEVSGAADYPSKQIQTAMAIIAIGSGASTISAIVFKTIEEAQQIQNDLFAMMDTLIDQELLSDTVYEAVMDVKTAVAKDIDQRVRELDRVVNYTLPETCSSLFLSNEIYGDLSREQEIIDRNNIAHPMFIIPIAPVKVAVSG